MCAFSGFSLNDSHSWAAKVFFLQIFSGCFLILSGLDQFRRFHFFNWMSVILICLLYADSVAFFSLYFLDEAPDPFFSSDAGRDFFGTLFGAIFIVITLVSGRYLEIEKNENGMMEIKD
jgi:hypothetical protein